ncbi:oxygenase MpaB family protein [Yinghuangia aomiensis]
MENLSRRRALKLGAALGLAGVALEAPKAWSWSSAGSLAATDTVTDPFTVWDPVPDQVAAQILADGATASVNTAWTAWTNNGDPLPAGMPAYLKSYLQQVNQLPSWADRSVLAASQQLYKRLSMYLFLSLSLGSGILSTVIPRESRAVYWSAGGADAKARAAKTFTFGYDMVAADAWSPDGHFVVTANKTRLVHSTVRNLLPTSAKFQATADQPKPISNRDILRTFHSTATFTHLNFASARALSAAEQNADLHAWQVALHLLGVQRQFIPASWADAVAPGRADAVARPGAHDRGHQPRPHPCWGTSSGPCWGWTPGSSARWSATSSGTRTPTGWACRTTSSRAASSRPAGRCTSPSARRRRGSCR